METLHNNPTYRIAGNAITMIPDWGPEDVIYVHVEPGSRIAFFDESLWNVSAKDYDAELDIKYKQDDFKEDDPDLLDPKPQSPSPNPPSDSEDPDNPGDPDTPSEPEEPDNPDDPNTQDPSPDSPSEPGEEEKTEQEKLEALMKHRAKQREIAYELFGYNLDGISFRTFPLDGYSTRLSVPRSDNYVEKEEEEEPEEKPEDTPSTDSGSFTPGNDNDLDLDNPSGGGSTDSPTPDDEEEPSFAGEDGLGDYAIYVRIDVGTRRGLIVFSTDFDKPALQYNNPDIDISPRYAWIKIGSYIHPTDKDGNLAAGRELTLDIGCLDTPKGQKESDSSGDWYVTDSSKKLVDFRTNDDESFWLFNKFKAISYQFVDWSSAVLNAKVKKFVEIIGLRTAEDTTLNTDDKTLGTTAWAARKFLRKDKDDKTKFGVKFMLTEGNKTLQFGKYPLMLGTSGNGFKMVDGNGVLQVDTLRVLKKMEAKEVEIQEVNYIGGSQVLTPANGFTVTKVAKLTYDAAGNIVVIEPPKEEEETPASSFTVNIHPAGTRDHADYTQSPGITIADIDITIQYGTGSSARDIALTSPIVFDPDGNVVLESDIPMNVAGNDVTIPAGTPVYVTSGDYYVFYDRPVHEGLSPLVGTPSTSGDSPNAPSSDSSTLPLVDSPSAGAGAPSAAEGAEPPVVGYRLYFDLTDGERTIRNTWQLGDLAYCQHWDVSPGKTQDFSTHFWWRRVLGMPAAANDYIDVYDLDGFDYESPRPVKKPTIDDDDDASAEGADETPNPLVDSWTRGLVDSSTRGLADSPSSGAEAPSDEDDEEEDTSDEEQQEAYYRFKDAISDAPQVGDKVVMLGNFCNKDRQSAIIMSASESGAPFFRMYKGIDTFNLAEADCFINLSQDEVAIQADAIKLESEKTLSETLDSLIKSQETIEDVSKQLDQSFLIHQDATDPAITPTLTNAPASEWTTVQERAEHIGDFFINRDGRVWKFMLLQGTLPSDKEEENPQSPSPNPQDPSPNPPETPEAPVFGWQLVEDEYLTSFIQRVDSKSTNFMTNADELPVGYKMGDLWIDASGDFPTVNGTKTYTKALLICIYTPGPTESPSIDHWQPVADFQSQAQGYIDEMTKIAARFDVNTDGKIETYFGVTKEELNQMAASWDTERKKIDHVGDLGYDDDLRELYEYTRTRTADDDSYTYQWELSKDAITKNVIATAAKAQDTADGKRTTFLFHRENGYVVWPKDYSEGDLWAPVSGTFQYTDSSGNVKQVDYLDDILVCTGTGHTADTGDSRILDWTGIGITHGERTKLEASFVAKGDFATMFARAVTGDETLAEADITTLVQKDEKTGEWFSNIRMKADKLVFDGQAEFVKTFKDAIDLEQTVQDLTKDKVNADPAAILSALNGKTTIAGGVIDTQYIDVENLKVKHLEGADGTFDGFIQTNFKNLSKLPDERPVDTGSKVYVLSGDNCHLMVQNDHIIRLPSSINHAGKRITLLNMSIQGGSTEVAAEDQLPILGYATHANPAVDQDANVRAIYFRGGVLEFLAVPDAEGKKCRWICITNKATMSFGTPDNAAIHTPRLLYYALLERNGDKVVNAWNVKDYLDNPPKITTPRKGVVGIDLSASLPSYIDLGQCMISATGAPGVNASANLATFAGIGNYDGTKKYFEVQTGNASNGLTNGSFILRIDY